MATANKAWQESGRGSTDEKLFMFFLWKRIRLKWHSIFSEGEVGTSLAGRYVLLEAFLSFTSWRVETGTHGCACAAG